MGNTNDDPATEVTRDLIGHETTDILKTKEVLTRSTGENQLPSENESFPLPNDPDSRPTIPIDGSGKPLQDIAPGTSKTPAASEPSITSSHLTSTAAQSLSSSLPSSGNSSVPMSELTSSGYAAGQASSRQIEPDTDDAAFDAQEEQDAVEQAGEGSIIVDSDDVATDAGYESDNHTAASTSLADSVRDYIYENGRRYHRFREGRYNFPNDDVE